MRERTDSGEPQPSGLWIDRALTVIMFAAAAALICLSPLGQ